MDGGIQATHEDFGGRDIECVYDVTNGNCEDRRGHGTHVAATVGGLLSGVAKNVNLKAVKCLDDQAAGTYAGLVTSIEKVLQRAKRTGNPSVVNMSVGGKTSSVLNEAIDNGVSTLDNLVFVAAAGNTNEDACKYVFFCFFCFDLI